LLLLFIIGGFGYFLREQLFGDKPVVISPQGLVLDVISTDTIEGVESFIYKPGDKIEFKSNLSVGSPRYIEDEETGVRTELSPYVIRLQFYVTYSNLEYYNLISSVNKTENASFTSIGDWMYLNDVIYPGEKYKDIISSLTLQTSSIGNIWQGRKCEIVLKYQTAYPTEEAIMENYPEILSGDPWMEIVTSIFSDYPGN